MRKQLFSLFILSISLSFSAIAAEPENDGRLVESLFAELRTGYHHDFADGTSSGQFTADYLNVNIAGHFSKNISYRIRQRMTKNPFDKEHILNGTDFAWISWQIDPKWHITAGKSAVAIGGYEFAEAPIDLYYTGDFCANLFQYYTVGIIGGYTPVPGQTIMLQISESPLANAAPSTFAYNLMWQGSMTKWWNTLWSVNFSEDRDNRFINYISLGNQFVFGDFTWEFDFMNRAGFAQSQFAMSDWSLVSNFEYKAGKFNLLLKGGYDFNSKDNFDKNGTAFDLAVAPGTEYAFVGGGAEYFPIAGSKDLRLHAICHWNNATKITRFDIGLTWRLQFVR